MHRFKTVYKAYDEKQGIDVAWSKINASDNNLMPEQVQDVVTEWSKGLGIDHPNIIRCYLCYEDDGTINLITEYFTSGNLRDYRHRHKHLGTRAVKKWARQILLGLSFLHSREPPMVHGDVRCDKLYINGHTGEIKIGDLGLATLLARRYEANGTPGVTKLSMPGDVFCFGLCMLELVTLRKLDAGHCGNVQVCVHVGLYKCLHCIAQEILDSVEDETAQAFIAACLGPEAQRPTAQELLEDPFLKRAADAGPPSATVVREASLEDVGAGTAPDDMEGSVSCEVGMVRGEDYTFHFSGSITDGVLAFRLHMQYEGDDGDERGGPVEVGKRTINFLYDPEVDTPDKIAEEISGEFNLSSTDRDICAAALSEWLAKNTPGT